MTSVKTKLINCLIFNFVTLVAAGILVISLRDESSTYFRFGPSYYNV